MSHTLPGKKITQPNNPAAGHDHETLAILPRKRQATRPPAVSWAAKAASLLSSASGAGGSGTRRAGPTAGARRASGLRATASRQSSTAAAPATAEARIGHGGGPAAPGRNPAQAGEPARDPGEGQAGS